MLIPETGWGSEEDTYLASSSAVPYHVSPEQWHFVVLALLIELPNKQLHTIVEFMMY